MAQLGKEKEAPKPNEPLLVPKRNNSGSGPLK